MNVKAEKLEQIIQIVNRNLLLVQAGQEDNVTPLEFRNLQRVDAGVFGTDKFAFEMVHFVKSGTDSKAPVGSLLQKWEKCFVKGLETLLVECAVVKDDIERDCFVSRVYCWFSEKLSERRALPRPPIDDEGMDHLRTSVRTMVGDEANTMKGLEKFKAPADASQGLPLSARAKSAEGGPRLTLPEDDSALHLPEITKPVGRIGRARSQPNMPAYNKQMYESKIASLLPDIPGAEKNYGLLFHKPESEAEIMMHEMWLARRRQEAFDWKAQQQITLLMDRIGLHKSRVESEALRKQESGSCLTTAVMSSPSKANAQAVGTASIMGRTASNSLLAGTSSGAGGTSRFVPAISGERPLSAKRQYAVLANEASLKDIKKFNPEAEEQQRNAAQQLRGKLTSPAGSRGRLRTASGSDHEGGLSSILPTDTKVTVTGGVHGQVRCSPLLQRLLCVTTALRQEQTSIARASRTAVVKVKAREYVPMRFKGDFGAPTKVVNYDKQEFYLQGTDSDDENENGKTFEKSRSGGQVGKGATVGFAATATASASSTMTSTGFGTGPVASTQGAPRSASAGTNRRPGANGYRDRPVSATRMKEIAFDDPECRVHYRHTNYRRMPLTSDQITWLRNVEEERAKQLEELRKKEQEEAAAKKAKSGDKKKGGAKAPAKDAKKKDKNAPPPKVEEKPKPKYKSAAHFMAKNFPTFDIGETSKFVMPPPAKSGGNKSAPVGSEGPRQATASPHSVSGLSPSTGGPPAPAQPSSTNYNIYNLEDITDDTYGPMRTMQMIECNRILDVCEEWDVPMDKRTLYRALVIPQDRPEALVTEQGVRNDVRCLMPNPLPKEYWKTPPAELLKGTAKKKKASKKKK